MVLHVIGTGSGGNAYLLKDGDNALLLDAGLPLLRIVRSMRTLNGLQGCIVTVGNRRIRDHRHVERRRYPAVHPARQRG